ncbi:hypothetical protein FOZ61_002963 [Perkinsus olseni]|uniref:Uncharacterized protein n=1 Tax=Perkinsus olseni TaxID=32597 RepID=A0A7J6M6S7_PEROL|nr:hypothetical protein FOZ61_002963 [Perkinsus olseni]KAF4667272.1 hypothetical protein FOL46_002601 [Perkinsus olseni]
MASSGRFRKQSKYLLSRLWAIIVIPYFLASPSGKAGASSTYEDQYMLMMEEVWNTRPSNFLWMEYPQFIQPLHFQRISERLNQLLSLPPSWNVPRELSIPIFNPSIVAIDQPQLAGAFLLTARMSNGPGCPHFQTAEYNSFNSGVLRNQLIVALLDESFDIIDATVVDFPDTFVATYEDSAVHRVEGPMDVRLSKGPRDDSWWITFFAEQNDVPGPHRGIHLAPLHVTFTGCEDVADRGWVEDNAAPPCPILNVYDSLRSCIEECTSLGADETEINGDYCICRKCRGTAVTPARIHKRHSIASLPHKEGSVCIERAYVDVREIVSVGDTGRTEKNWQILEFSVDVSEVWVHYSIQPSIKVRISLDWPQGITTNDEPRPVRVRYVEIDAASATWWDSSVIHRVSNVRGGYCCTLVSVDWLSADMQQFITFNHPNSTSLLLGVGHMQRIRQLGDHMQGNRTRLEGIRNTRAYKQFLFLLTPGYPFTMVGVSPEFCFESVGAFSPASGNPTCEAIQFIAGITVSSSVQTDDDLDLVVSYGINDCEAVVTRFAVSSVLGRVRPTLNEAVDWDHDDI